MARRSARKAAGLPQVEPSAPDSLPNSRRRRVALASAAAVTVIGVLAGALLATSGGGSRSRGAAEGHSISWGSVPHLQSGTPPWQSESNLLTQRLAPAGLHALTMEGSALHIHQHLDLYVNGRHVTVPALVGIDPRAGFLTELHTHDASGIVHVESPVLRSFRLGQFFCEWGVKLTAACLGPYRGRISWWVDGVRMHGNPAQLVLKEHQEIVLAAGKPPASVPASYRFPAGL